jgi:tetratricopeptide (TPR) repeat protein
MGYGTKTDFATGRKLNLDKSYHALIKPVVESKGIICVRADEIPHSGPIDVPMYRELYTADIVVADISTANLNAFYELGVRHALRPRTTIIISEDKLCAPFNTNHIKIEKYTHLGESIDYFEVLRFQKKLGEMIDYVLNDTVPDSPVYTFLDNLIPPGLQEQAKKVVKEVNKALSEAKPKSPAGPVEVEINGEFYGETETLSEKIQQGEEAIKNKEYSKAKELFQSALQQSDCDNSKVVSSNIAYLIHRLALATYKTEEPSKKAALLEANKLLHRLDLSHTNDTETVVLGGAIEKKLYEIGEGVEHLANAILLHQRGFFLLNNRYNGTNLAYLLDCRVDSSLDKTDQDRIADLVWANRMRQFVLENCEKDWNALVKREKNQYKKHLEGYQFSTSVNATEDEQKFWILVNKAEAHFALGNFKEYEKARLQAEVVDHDDWMMLGFTRQLDELEKVLTKYGHLLRPAWNTPH